MQPYQQEYRKTAHQKWVARTNVTHSRNRPLARSARRYKGVIGESKEGIGGTRNPPCPPWPPEAPKIKGKRIDYHLRKPNARKNRKIDPRRIQECIERSTPLSRLHRQLPFQVSLLKECPPYSAEQQKKPPAHRNHPTNRQPLTPCLISNTPRKHLRPSIHLQ